MVLEPGHQVLWWVVLPLLLLRSESKKTKMIALGLSVLDGLYGCWKLSTLENCVLLGPTGSPKLPM